MAAVLAPFEPKGDVPEWRLIYDELRKLNVGDEITYRELSAALERPFVKNRNPLYRAADELLHADRRALETVRGRGYRIAAAESHGILARRQIKFSRRRLRKGRALVENVRTEELPAHVARLYQMQAVNFSWAEQALQQAVRARTEVAEVRSKVAEVADGDAENRRRIEALEAALARLNQSA